MQYTYGKYAPAFTRLIYDPIDYTRSSRSYIHTNPLPPPISHIHRHITYHTSEETPVTLDGFFKIVIILDESGSMMPIKNDMIKSINSMLTEQKQVKDRPATFTFVKFSDNINRVIKNKPIEGISLLEDKDYNPQGSTALYDAIGDTINWFRNEKDVLMCVVTDGEENASRKYDKYTINDMIERKKRNDKWSFVYLSSDLKTKLQGDNIGISRSAQSSNRVYEQQYFGDFISKEFNNAVLNYRNDGISINEQLNIR